MIRERDNFIIKRPATGSYNNTGDYIPAGDPTFINSKGNIQPYKEGTKKDPKLESINTSGAIKIYTKTILFEASENRAADQIIFNGKEYELFIVNKWVNHYEAIGVLIHA